MDNRKTILVCDSDYAFLNEMEKSLANEGYDVDTIDNASDLIPSGIRLQPNVIIVNPDTPAFNEYDVCRQLMQDQRIQIMLVVNPQLRTWERLGDCLVEDVITKPVEMAYLVNLLEKHMSVDQ